MNWANDPTVRAAIFVGEALVKNDPPPLPIIPQSIVTVGDALRKMNVPHRAYITVSWMLVDRYGDPVYSTSQTNLIWRESDIG